MELFYSRGISEGATMLDSEESNHCIRVLRYRSGNTINVIDGVSNLYVCRIVDDNPKGVSFEILEKVEGYGSHPYRLHLAVAPPKNNERFEWFAQKATEIGVDEITPLFGEYSQRKVFKGDRVERILVSAAKQSHKSAVPVLHDAESVTDFLEKDFGVSLPGHAPVKLICYCDEVDSLGESKADIKRVLASAFESSLNRGDAVACAPESRDIIIMIGPEGDFSRNEIAKAVKCGWKPVSLGDSRLRIETAALVATAAVYIEFI